MKYKDTEKKYDAFLDLHKTKVIDEKRKMANKLLEKKVFLSMAVIYCEKEEHEGKEEIQDVFLQDLEEQEVYMEDIRKWLLSKNIRRKKLCPGCLEMVREAFHHTRKCPYSEYKTFCHECPTPSYSKSSREKMALIMGSARKELIKRHPLLSIRFLFNLIRAKRNMRKLKKGREV